MRKHYRGVEVCEIPPNGQGVAALQALGILAGIDHTGGRALDRVHLQAEAMKLAFADAERHVHDGPLPAGYLDDEYLAGRRALIDPARAGSPTAGPLERSGTVYLCAVDEERNACSLIQSVYYPFGSLVVAPGTGVVLHNRGAGFTLEPGHPNRMAPGKRPYHTIIPGLLLRDGALLGPFGLMGGHMQPQGHLQLVSHLVDRGLDPQAAIDEPRWRLDSEARGDWALALEAPLHRLAPALARRGHRAALRSDRSGLRRRPAGTRAGRRADRRQRVAQGRRRARLLTRLAARRRKTRRAARRRPDDDRILAGIHQGRLPRLPRLPNAWPVGEFPLWFRGTSPLAASTSARPISTVTQDRTTPFPRFAQTSSRSRRWEGWSPKFHPPGASSKLRQY